MFIWKNQYLKKNYYNKSISSELDEVIQNRTTVYSKDITRFSIISDEYQNASYVIAPIISNGDAVGAVIIFSTTEKIDDFIIKTGVIAAKFLGKYIE